MVRVLVRTADVNLACPNDELPLYRAIIEGNFLIVEALAEAGADVNANTSTKTPSSTTRYTKGA